MVNRSNGAMCGRYVSRTEAAIERDWGLREPFPPFSSYNVAPTMPVPVVRRNVDGEREAVLMRWGLIPFWANGVPPKYSTINATCERIEQAPAYRGTWRRGQRCLFAVNGFYEWQSVPGRKTRQPWYIRLPGQELFAIGGVWDRSRRDDGSFIESCALITVPANELMARIHNTKKRMPFILPRSDYGAWLGTDSETAADLMGPYPASEMDAWPVSMHVNKPENDDPSCCAPI